MYFLERPKGPNVVGVTERNFERRLKDPDVIGGNGRRFVEQAEENRRCG